jgi:hypothetical protein
MAANKRDSEVNLHLFEMVNEKLVQEINHLHNV